MKLLYVVHQFFPECHSGTEQYCLAAAREARRRGDEVTIFSLHPIHDRDDPPLLLFEEPYDGFRVIRLRHWAGLNPNDVLRDYDNPLAGELFRDVVAKLGPQAVHFFHLRNLGANLIRVAKDARLRTVVSLMDFWYLCPKFILLRRDGSLCEGPPEGGLGCVPCMYPELEGALTGVDSREAARRFAAASRPANDASPASRFAALIRRKDFLLRQLGLADDVIAPSRFLSAMFGKNGFPQERIRVVPYGLEPGRVARAQVQRPRSPLRVGFIGVLSPWKAPHVVVEAVRRVAGPIRLTVHGRTDEHMFSDYIASVRRAAEGDGRISFPGPFDRERIGEVLAEMDVLVVPSTWYENTPFVILEAFAAGVPVIASDLGGMSEIVREGKNGFLFAAGDSEALARVLRQCVEEPGRVAALETDDVAAIAANYDEFLACYGGA